MTKPLASTPERRWPLAAALAVGFLPNLIQLAYPFSGDHFIHGWVGLRMIHGEWPYVDHATHNLPGGAMLYSIPAAIFGPGALGYRLLDWLWQCATGILMYRIASSMAGRTAGFLAAAVYGCWYGSLGSGIAGNKDAMITLLYLAPIVIVYSRSSLNASGMAFAGLICGFAILVKPTHALWGLILIVWLARRGGREASKKMSGPKAALVFFATVFSPVLLVFIPYLAAGHFQPVWECLFDYNRAYGQVRASFDPNHIFPEASVLALGVCLTVWAISRRLQNGSDGLAVLTAAWPLAATVGAFAQGKFYPYHMAPVTAALCFWTAVGVVDAFRLTRAELRDRSFGILVIGLIAVFVRTLDARTPLWMLCYQTVSCVVLYLAARRSFGVSVGIGSAVAYGLLSIASLSAIRFDPYLLALPVCVGVTGIVARSTRQQIAAIVVGVATYAGAVLVGPAIWPNVFSESPSISLLPTHLIPSDLAEIGLGIVGIWGAVLFTRQLGAGNGRIWIAWPAISFVFASASFTAPERSTFPLFVGGPLWLAIGAIDISGKLVALWQRIPPLARTYAGVAAPIVTIILFRVVFTTLLSDWNAVLGFVAGDVEPEGLIKRFGKPLTNEAGTVAEYIRNNCTPEDRIISFDHFGAVGYLANRRSPSRFYMPRFIFPFVDSQDAENSDSLWLRWRKEFVRRTETDPPKFIVFQRGVPLETFKHPTKDAAEFMGEDIPEFASIFARDYRRTGTIEGFEIYERNDRP
jgi:hypothetical protein